MATSPEPRPAQVRSEAAREASRRNGAKSKGPKTAAGKHNAARNALRHGLRASDPVVLEAMPSWVPEKSAQLETALEHIGQTRREYLDRYVLHLVMIERTDRLIAEEFARVLTVLSDDEQSVGLAVPADEIDLSWLKALFGYRKRFRATRDRCIIKLVTHGPWLKQLRQARLAQ